MFAKLHLLSQDAPESGNGLAWRAHPYLRIDGNVARGPAVFEWSQRQRDDLETLWRNPTADGARERLARDLAVFCDKLGWVPCADELRDAVTRGDEYLVTLSAVPPELYLLPWEVLQVGAEGTYLSDYTSAQVRYAVPGLEPRKLQGAPPAPGVLFVWSAAGGPVPHDEQAQAIRAATEAGGVAFRELANADEAALEAALDAGAPSVIHLLCHGSPGADGEPSLLVLGTTDQRRELTATRLARMLRDHSDAIRLVVLSACGGGDGYNDPMYVGSVAQELHKKGIPNVVASRYPLSIAGSRIMTRTLYDQLLREAWSLERSLRHTRATLFRTDEDGAAHAGDAYSIQLYAHDTERFRSDNDVEAVRPVLASYPFGAADRPVPVKGPPAAELTLKLDGDPTLTNDQLTRELRELCEDRDLTVKLSTGGARTVRTTVDGVQRLLNAQRAKLRATADARAANSVARPHAPDTTVNLRGIDAIVSARIATGSAPAIDTTAIASQADAAVNAPAADPASSASAATVNAASATDATAVQTAPPAVGAAKIAATPTSTALVMHTDAPRIPGYRVVGVLGEGGMGRVYAAEQNAPRRPVAIKVLHARAASALARFRAEAEIMARLDHPGIARVLEAGDADGHPFLVMEHVDGVTLDRYAQPLPRAQRLALFAALCDAVHHAHVKGVIHRDLKPANVMVQPGDRVVVLDFGVARLAANNGSSTSASGETQAGELIGTPLYMSPEQARLRPDEVDARSDVYTLGVMLYELLTGELPYPVAIRELTLPAVACVICEDEPVRLSKRDLSLRGDLEAIADKALRKLPSERYQSVAALADDLRRHLDGAAVSVRTPGATEQLRRFIRRRPLFAGGIGAAIVAAAVFVFVVTQLWLAADHAQHRSEDARAALETRTDQLTLRQARAALARDPTEAIAWLATLTGDPTSAAARSIDADAAWGIAEEALGRGVASHVLTGHTDEIHWIEALAGSADFETASYDGRVIVWRAPSFAPTVVFRAQHGRVRLARPSPDGARIAIGTDDTTVHIVSTDGAPVAELTGHTGAVQHIAWSPDGAWLATGDDRGGVWLWPRGSAPGRELARPSAEAKVISAIGFSANSTTLIVGDHAGGLQLWQPRSGLAISAAIDTEIADVWTDGRQVIAVDTAGTVHTRRIDGDQLVSVRDVATGQPTKRAAFSTAGTAGTTDGASVILSGIAGTVMRVDGDAIETIASHRAQARCIAITPDGRWLATASDDGVMQVTDRTSGRHLTLRGHTARIRHLAFAGNTLLSADAEGIVRRWPLDAIPPSVLDGNGAPVEHLATARDGQHLAAIDTAGNVTVWSLGDRLHPTPGDGGRTVVGHATGHVSTIVLAGADPIAVTGTAEGDVTWWQQFPVRRHVKGLVRAIATSAEFVAVATAAGPVSLFSTGGGEVAELPGNTGGTEAVDFDPSGALLATGGQDRVIRVYRITTGFPALTQLPGPTGDTHFIAFAPSGNRLLAAGADGAVYSWPVAHGAVDAANPAVLARHTGAITSLAISPDGWLASAGRDDLVMRRALGDSRHDAIGIGGAASAIAFDTTSGIQAVTHSGAVIRATPGSLSTVIDHGVHTGVPVAPDRLAVALDDGAIIVETLGPHSIDQLAALLARATTYRIAR